MGKTNASKAEVRRTDEKRDNDPHGDGGKKLGRDREQDGSEGKIGSSGTVRKGADQPGLKPVTHGKTLGYLINSLARQIAASRKRIEDEAQQIEQMEEEKAGLEQVLLEWQEKVKGLDQTE